MLAIFNKKLPPFLLLFTAMLIVFAIASFKPKVDTQFIEESPMEYLCKLGAFYRFDFREGPNIVGGWGRFICTIPELSGCGEKNPLGYCSNSWSWKHKIGGPATLVCASQVCKQENTGDDFGDYVCMGGVTINELVSTVRNYDPEVNDDTGGWIRRECFTTDQISSEANCIEAGGSTYTINYCAQTDAIKNWAINNKSDCINAGGFWKNEYSGCRIPQVFLIEIDPDNPNANCGGVYGDEACAVMRWRRTVDEDVLIMSTLNI